MIDRDLKDQPAEARRATLRFLAERADLLDTHLVHDLLEACSPLVQTNPMRAVNEWHEVINNTRLAKDLRDTLDAGEVPGGYESLDEADMQAGTYEADVDGALRLLAPDVLAPVSPLRTLSEARSGRHPSGRLALVGSNGSDGAA